MKWVERLKNGLSKTSNNIVQAFKHSKLDAAALGDIEDALLMADMGSAVTSQIIKELSQDKFDSQITDKEIRALIAAKIEKILSPVMGEIKLRSKPHVIVLCGVNGNGKTTTAGKLAAQYKMHGKKVMMAACDTFRAAAVEQLAVWSDKVGCQLITGVVGSDPASVAYQAVEAAHRGDVDLLLIDTAGRLHNKTNLMEELNKIVRVVAKVDSSIEPDVILVIDATTGQNAIAQVETFNKAVNLGGIIITKLDGTAKGGIIVSVADKFKIPIMAVGVGEKVDDLNPFSASEYANSLMDI